MGRAGCTAQKVRETYANYCEGVPPQRQEPRDPVQAVRADDAISEITISSRRSRRRQQLRVHEHIIQRTRQITIRM
eukprot:1697500-Amphidinium_carterae.2